MNIKYPLVKVQLSSNDGNAFSITAAVSLAMKRAGVSEEECQRYREESLSGDYDNVIQTAMRWVAVS